MTLKTNQRFSELYTTQKKYIICYGGSGSGKSYAIAQWATIALLSYERRRIIIARKVAVSLRQSVFALLRAIISDLGLSDIIRTNKTEMLFENMANGNQLILVGLDDVEKLKSIFDPTDAWIEEADQVEQNDFEEINRRIRSITKTPPKIILSFNPTSAYSWIKRCFFDADTYKEDMLVIHSTYRDNAFISPEYKKVIRQLEETNPSAYRVYGLGEWGVVEGLVFDQWSEATPPSSARFIGYGLDFGYTNDPTALVAVYESETDIWLDEKIYQTRLTNSDIIALMKDLGIRHTDEIIADCAEPKSIDDIFSAGFNIHPADKGKDSVRFGIDYIKSKRLHVTPQSCNIKKELSAYCWAKDKNGKSINSPVDAFNHSLDAVRYRLTKGKMVADISSGYVKALLGM